MNKNDYLTKLYKLKSIPKPFSWLLWIIPLFIIVSYKNGINTGLYVSGLMISGTLLGAIIPVVIGVFLKRYDLKIIYGEIAIFMISTIILYLIVPDKKLLILMTPFSIPLLIIGFLDLRRQNL